MMSMRQCSIREAAVEADYLSCVALFENARNFSTSAIQNAGAARGSPARIARIKLHCFNYVYSRSPV